MITSKNLHVGVILRLTWRQLAFFIGMGVLVPAVRHAAGWDWLHVSTSTVGPMGTALAIFLAFRNSSAYERWWEGRKLWGSLVNQSRGFARQVLTFLDPMAAATADEQRALVRRQVAYAYALNCALRKTPEKLSEPLALWVDDPTQRERILKSRSAPTTILQMQAEALARLHKDGHLNALHQVELDRTLGVITDVQGSCERIKNTPFLRQYDFYPRIFVYVYTFFVPFSLVDELEFMTAFLSVPVSFLFLALARVGAANEDPFEGRFTDVPLDALCRTIETSLREQLGEPPETLPPPLTPVQGFLY